MKKIIGIFLLCLLLSGCATYRFQPGAKPYDAGFVVARDNYPIVEYTLGNENSVPEDLGLAKERFKRRHRMVEHYYKKMGYIENNFNMVFWKPCICLCKTIKGIFRLPFVAISDFRYDHNPQYRERIIKKEQEEDALEEANIQTEKDKLGKYIQQDLAREEKTIKIPPVNVSAQDEGVLLPKEGSVQEQVTAEEKVAVKEETSLPVPQVVSARQIDQSANLNAVIVAKPVKGYSPLRVRFYGNKSRAKTGKIVSYHWDFGDGDTSVLINPGNTYYSGSFEAQDFNVTLTVRDNLGRVATATATIEVLNK